ncbi:diversity-generating retroelement protein Avd [Thiothrix lacustris]|uniref:diversity-generating retroelement protein Avd n=1 Tax=Thiothrix lacustris TaxID=525917 RepID=UPI0027E43D5F|nr:diversity-generating retroelement protein Avd [Thiothrix lacustris]WMP17278.1 diversity-generating retroelement protein Avd [Thiothrix lacustris]
MEGKQVQPSTPKAVQDCRDLLLWMLPQLDKLPRNRRYTLGEKLENRLLVILESLVTAAYAPNKRTFLFQANRDLEVCRHLWRLCYDIHAIPSGSYQHGGKLMLELGRQVGGWMKDSR